MATLLTVSSAGSGALAGFALGLVGELLDVADDVPWPSLAVALVAVVVLDRFVPPVSVRRQVPQLWGRVFSARTTAVLYGARLGVGPLTILRTWWWWLAVIVGALAGVWVSVGVGALFGAARIVVMLAVGTRAGGLRRSERFAVLSGVATALVLIAFVAVADSSADRDGDRHVTSTGSRSGTTDDVRRRGEDASDDETAPSRAPTTTATPTTVPADPALEASLPLDLGGGYERVADDPARALGAIDLDTAAAIEEDEQAERSLLETRHFELGHARAWRHDDGRTAYVAAYRFGASADADAYLVDGFITLEGRGARVYDVTNPAGARGFSQAATEGEASEVAHGVAFVRADVFFLVVVTSPNSAAGPEDALAVAQRVSEMSPPPSS